MLRSLARILPILLLLIPLSIQNIRAGGPWYVSPTGHDGNDCLSPATACATIGSAIGRAADSDTIHIAAGSYSETLFIDKNLSLLGEGAESTIIDGGGAGRVIEIAEGDSVSLVDLTIQNGQIATSTGAGIRNLGNLTVQRVVVQDNSISGTDSGDVGGGIFNIGTLLLQESTIRRNSADRGGGIFNAGGSTLTIENSTISENQARAGAGIANWATLQLTNVTLSGNEASGSGGGLDHSQGTSTLLNVTITANITPLGGGILLGMGSVQLTNSIIAQNSGGDCYLYAPATSGGHNLDSDGSCGLSEPSDLPSTDPLLSNLADNGGPTLTHALLAESPAIDGGSDVGCPATDQRGVARPQRERCDIGAFESDRPADPPPEGPWYVSPGGDDTADCLSPATACQSIDAAISKARNNNIIHVAAGTYDENVIVTKSLTIQGEGKNETIVDGGAHDRVIRVASGVTVTISSLTIQNGALAGGTGAGLYNEGTLTLDQVIVQDNDVIGTMGSDIGGGIYNDHVLLLRDSTVRRNAANRGGGIFSGGASSLTIERSTINDNQAAEGAGINNYGSLQLTNVTISGNRATTEGGGLANGSSATLLNVTLAHNIAPANMGGGLLNRSSLELKNSLIANNGVGRDCYLIVVIFSNGYNLDSDGSCGLGGTGDLSATDPNLVPLDDNGGPTRTHALLESSPAINAGTNDGCPTTDQRGESRPKGERCDIGALESDFSSRLIQIYLPLIVAGR